MGTRRVAHGKGNQQVALHSKVKVGRQRAKNGDQTVTHGETALGEPSLRS
jgi:hypothetical protein